MSGVQRTVTPVDGSVYCERPLADDAEVERTLAAAAQAQRGWRATPLGERVDAVERVVEWFLDHADEIGEQLTWQMGRPVSQSPNEIRRGFQERARHMAAIAPDCLADIPGPVTEGIERFIRRVPLGVVLVVAPWNYPYLASVNGVVPALLAGNAVVLKCSAQTPLVGEHYAAAAQAAGLPDGLFAHVIADHDMVARMIGDDRVQFAAFTGSVPGGHAIQQAAANRFIATNLELGGKDPAYVRPDADLAKTIPEVVDGAFFNAGQSCCAVERVYVHRDVWDEFVDGFASLTAQYRLGHPLDPATDLGPMVRPSAADVVREQIAEAVDKGARALLPLQDGDGAYLPPQVLVDVDHAMRVMTEESFGPVVGLMPVESDDEAVALMNDSRYGLTASIWTADVEAAIALGDRIDTGTVYLNRCDYLDPALAWTGVKDTGRGVSLSPLAFDALTRPKSFHLRKAL